jgi:hypothetical protein
MNQKLKYLSHISPVMYDPLNSLVMHNVQFILIFSTSQINRHLAFNIKHVFLYRTVNLFN